VLHTLTWVATVVLGVAIVASVLLQSGRAYGVTGSIAGAAESLFGSRRGGLDDALARVTTVLGLLFLGTVLLLGSGAVGR
jgi:preprotein translocase subunit SecG